MTPNITFLKAELKDLEDLAQREKVDVGCSQLYNEGVDGSYVLLIQERSFNESRKVYVIVLTVSSREPVDWI